MGGGLCLPGTYIGTHQVVSNRKKVAGLFCKLNFRTNLLALSIWKFWSLHWVWICDIPLSNKKKAVKTQQSTSIWSVCQRNRSLGEHQEARPRVDEWSWPRGSFGWSVAPYSKMLQVWFLVGHILVLQVLSSIRCAWGEPIDVSRVRIKTNKVDVCHIVKGLGHLKGKQSLFRGVQLKKTKT